LRCRPAVVACKTNQKPTKILPKRNCKEKISTTKLPQCDPAIGLDLLQNKQCANNYNDQQISNLARARSAFHLSALEATKSKAYNQLYVFHIALNQSAALMTRYKPRHSFSHFILATILEKC